MKPPTINKNPKVNEFMKGNQFRLGKKMSKEAKMVRKEKMGDSICAHRRIPVLDLDTNTVYLSIKHASEDLGISTFKIIRALQKSKELSSGKKIVRFEPDSLPSGF